jgi:squalene-hopene/tetraprenyl-beta-curcumene cyclase
LAAAVVVLALLSPGFTAGDEKASSHQQLVDRAVAFLRVTGQAADGSYAAYAGPGVTSVVTTGLLRNGVSPRDPLVAKSLRYLEGFVQPDGGVYQAGTLYGNYETCLAIMCFTQANQDGRYDEILAKAEKYIKKIQWDEDEGKDITSNSYGGAGYGKHERPDLSNTNFLIDALAARGVGPEDEAMQRALIFVSRCQNLETEHNMTPFAAKNPDGGFYYTPAAGGSSQAGETPAGGLRSYGSMTYAGLKSMIYAGVGPDDPRVKAAFKWISKHYDLQQNPGMGDAGLYYYFHTFAKALDTYGEATLKTADGTERKWAQDLAAELVRLQRPDGSWTNENDRWMEGDPRLVTAYCAMSLNVMAKWLK